MKIDTDSFFQNRIDSLLLTTSWVETVKVRLGIEAVSQVWTDRPTWYFWLSGSPGTYQLQLTEPGRNDDQPEVIRGIFSVKCYPFIDHDVFKTFSEKERRIAGSRLLDDTHTPRFEDRGKIPDSLFNVAVIDYAVDRDDTWACLTIESLDTLREFKHGPPARDIDPVQKDAHGRAGKADRSVPGWQLGLPLFDRLLCMVAFFSRTSPYRIKVVRASGFDYTCSDATPPVINAAEDISCYTASVLFGPAGGEDPSHGLAGPSLMAQAADTDPSEVLYDESFPENRFQPPGESSLTGISNVFPINRQWWTLANATDRSELGSTCGCHGGNGHPYLSVGGHKRVVRLDRCDR